MQKRIIFNLSLLKRIKISRDNTFQFFLTYLLFISPLFLTQCTRNSDVITLINLNQDLVVNSFVEINPQNFQNDNIFLKAISVEDPNIQFLLQNSPSLFFSKDTSLQNSFSAILPPSVIAGKYEISKYNPEPVFSFEEDKDGKLTISENGKKVMTYNFGMQLPEGVPERYRRSSYIHPVYDLKGNIFTDDFPGDHYHHRGLSWMWPKVFIDTARYDLWHIYGIAGDLEGIHQVFEKWLVREAGPVCATIGVKNIWKLDNGQKVMDEWVYVKVYGSSGNVRVIDIKLTWRANTFITLEGQTTKGYGGLNFRFAPRTETTITSNLGNEEDSDLKKLPWTDLSAMFANNDYFSGVSIFQHKTNNNFPAGWCLRHYGFLGVAWPGVDPYMMKTGETLSLSFRILVHQEDAETAKVKNYYEVFENPPEIKEGIEKE